MHNHNCSHTLGLLLDYVIPNLWPASAIAEATCPATYISDSRRFLKVIRIFLVKVPNESAILEHSKNMHIDGFTCNSSEIQLFEVTQLSHQLFQVSQKWHQK